MPRTVAAGERSTAPGTGLGFRTVGFENDFASGVLIDRYVVSGDGHARELVSQLSSPMWATEEILGLVEWMRAYNEEHPDDPVRFLGTDVLQLRQLSFDEISTYAADVAPERAADVDATLAEVALRGEPYEQFAWFFGLAADERQAVVERADDLVRLVATLPVGSDPVLKANIDQHARAIAGWYENYSHDTEFRAGRERFIADSIAWWQGLTGSRVAYWAANVHTAAAPALSYSNPGDGEQTGVMAGGHIAARLGDGYVSVGSWVGQGEISPDYSDPHPHPFGPPPAEFLEATLGRAEADTYLLPLDTDVPGDVARWRAGAATTLMIVPSLAGDEDPAAHTMTVPSLAEAFDAVVYIDESSASRLLGR
ncbi:erythromycin esterase family protein [Desertimonas flava]|uniref:erythromycin esterase family protein n=1 Tax=Desertimonas flava TaxID=2064846 RepID=UPI0013C4C817|nr:erythromycin esterase family protein [Desertimonas flava]